jgi:hypothetical protein
MRRMLLVLALAAVLGLALAPAASASGPGPYGYIVGYVRTDWGIAYVNGQTVTLRGGWFCIPARPGAQAVNVSVPGAGTVMRWVDVPAGGVAVVPFGRM